MLAGCGNNGADNSNAPTTSAGGATNAPPSMTSAPPPAKPGLSTKQKVVLLAGAALLFYLYKRDVAQNAKAAQNGAGAKPQLYREEKGPNAGAIYYRKNDPSHTVVWVTAPSGTVAVPADQVQQYLPDYQQYQRQPAPSVPAGAQTEPATQYDPSLATAGGSPPGPGQ